MDSFNPYSSALLQLPAELLMKICHNF